MTKRVLALLPVLLFAVGCQQTTVDTPTAAIKSMNVGDVTPDGLTMNFNVAVSNPNKIDLPVSGADYKLGLGGVDVVTDTAQTTGAIPALGSKDVSMPVHVKFQDLLKAKNALAAGKGDVPYDLSGGVNFNPGGYVAMLGTRALRVPVQYTGTLHLRQILQDNIRAVSQSSAAQELMAQFATDGLGALMGR